MTDFQKELILLGICLSFFFVSFGYVGIATEKIKMISSPVVMTEVLKIDETGFSISDPHCP